MTYAPGRPSMFVRIVRLREHAVLPTRATALSSGLDLRACFEEPSMSMIIQWGSCLRVPTGIAIELQAPFVGEAQVRPRSGLSSRGCLASFGTIDHDYHSEIYVVLHGVKREMFLKIENGDRIAQLVIAPIAMVELDEVDELTETGRGSFGSSGLK